MNKGEKTKQKILDNALVLFSTKGYEATSLKDIASSIEIKAPSIYAHFSSKEVLFEKVTEYVKTDYIEFIRKQAVDLHLFSSKEMLYELLVELNKYFYNTDLGLFIKKFGFVPPEKFKVLLNNMYAETEREIEKLLYTILEGDSKERFVDKQSIVTSFLCILDGTLFYLMNFPYEEYERRLNRTWEVFWNGIVIK
ncbi:TetR/AcrR family transcriptional regulator [Bacillus spongiae]|uniref:TetR/AcrR family transcriptional regulator n=1 Tax=Bacillus spongiae TaxID=2683610 RepID=A0ABU8HG51_9BACI